LSVGREAGAARVTGANAGPFALADGDLLRLTLDLPGGTITRNVRALTEQFQNLGSVIASEVAALLDSELPGVNVSVTSDGRIVVATSDRGSGVTVRLPASPLTTKLGLVTSVPVTGSDPNAAKLTSTAETFALVDGDQLVVRVDQDPPRTVVFRAADFNN